MTKTETKKIKLQCSLINFGVQYKFYITKISNIHRAKMAISCFNFEKTQGANHHFRRLMVEQFDSIYFRLSPVPYISVWLWILSISRSAIPVAPKSVYLRMCWWKGCCLAVAWLYFDLSLDAVFWAWGLFLSLDAGIWASRLEYEPGEWRPGFVPQGWDLPKMRKSLVGKWSITKSD